MRCFVFFQDPLQYSNEKNNILSSTVIFASANTTASCGVTVMVILRENPLLFFFCSSVSSNESESRVSCKSQAGDSACDLETASRIMIGWHRRNFHKNSGTKDDVHGTPYVNEYADV